MYTQAKQSSNLVDTSNEWVGCRSSSEREIAKLSRAMINLAFKSTQPVGISGSTSDLRTEKETFLFGHPTERAEVEEEEEEADSRHC